MIAICVYTDQCTISKEVTYILGTLLLVDPPTKIILHSVSEQHTEVFGS